MQNWCTKNCFEQSNGSQMIFDMRETKKFTSNRKIMEYLTPVKSYIPPNSSTDQSSIQRTPSTKLINRSFSFKTTDDPKNLPIKYGPKNQRQQLPIKSSTKFMNRSSSLKIIDDIAHLPIRYEPRSIKIQRQQLPVKSNSFNKKNNVNINFCFNPNLAPPALVISQNSIPNTKWSQPKFSSQNDFSHHKLLAVPESVPRSAIERFSMRQRLFPAVTKNNTLLDKKKITQYEDQISSEFHERSQPFTETRSIYNTEIQQQPSGY